MLNDTFPRASSGRPRHSGPLGTRGLTGRTPDELELERKPRATDARQQPRDVSPPTSLAPDRERGVAVNPRHDVYARLERVKALWRDISQTPKASARYEDLVDEIRAEALAYRAGVDAARGVDRRHSGSERRQCGLARGIERRQRDRR